MRRIFLWAMLLGGLLTAPAAAETVGPSGAPLPRFVSLAATKAYMRTGPGRQYPIEWVYTRRELPLEVIDEDGPWRQVRDHEGVTGWMHVTLLSGRRTAMITGRTRKLYSDSSAVSVVRLTADPGVIGEVVKCVDIWCRLEIDGTRAWIERRNLWGVYEQEKLD